MPTETRITLAEFVASNRLKMTSKRIVPNPARASEWDQSASHYSCTFKLDGKQMTVPFSISMGSGLSGDPKAEDVLTCLSSDAAGFENAQDFEDWASEYGYDTDSRKAERIFKTIETQANKLKTFLGDDLYQTLLWETENLYLH